MQRTAVGDLANEVAPWIEGLARVGYIAVGVVYATVGALSAIAGIRGGGAPDKNDAFAFILDKPFGKILLFVITAGLIGYALWRVISGITDGERRGNKPKGLALRASSIVRGLLYAAFAVEVGRYATKRDAVTTSDQTAKHWTARLMDSPFGEWLVGAVGVVIIGAGIYQLTRAWKAKLGSQLRLDGMQPATKRRVVAISRFGLAARGVVFAVVGISRWASRSSSLESVTTRRRPREPPAPWKCSRGPSAARSSC
jgi:hypothetical protein